MEFQSWIIFAILIIVLYNIYYFENRTYDTQLLKWWIGMEIVIRLINMWFEETI